MAGGVPTDRDRLLRFAVLEQSAKYDTIFELHPLPNKVGTKPANALGLHDLWGNAAEWVTGAGEESVVRGGHFGLDADELTDDWRAVEDLDVWNETHILYPKPAIGYRDFPYAGIRLALDEDQAPAETIRPPAP